MDIVAVALLVAFLVLLLSRGGGARWTRKSAASTTK
jgi:hypothetical protein